MRSGQLGTHHAIKLNATKSGSALAFAVILFAVVAIFAIAIMAMAAGEMRLTVAENNKDQAYYVARSAAEATLKWVGKNYDSSAVYSVLPTSAGTKTSTGHTLSDGTPYTITVTRDSNNLINIETTATYKGLSSNASVSFYFNDSSFILFDHAIYSINSFTGFNSGNNQSVSVYNGNVASGFAGYNDDEIAAYKQRFFEGSYPSGDFQQGYGSSYDFKAVTISDDLVPQPLPYTPADAIVTDKINLMPNVAGITNALGQINGNVYFNSLELNGGTLMIDNTSNPVHVDIDHLVISGHSKIDLVNKTPGSYRVFIYVNETIDWKKNQTFSIADPTPLPESLVYFILNGVNAADNENSIEFSGNTSMYAYIYTPNAITLFGGEIHIYGAIIDGNFGWNGGVEVYYRKPTLTGTPFEDLIEGQDLISLKGITWGK